MERRDVVIVGGGPAAAATALFLARRDPALARRTLIVEKARHPRMKVCAGGLIPHALDCLDELGVGVPVPHVVVDRARVDVPGRRLDVDDRRCCVVIRRAELDAALLDAARAAGVEVHEREKVVSLARRDDAIDITTDGGAYRARVVIGADGSGSVVRRTLVTPDEGDAPIGRAIMADVPIASGASWDGHERARYEFDFRAVPSGLRGYAWAFPCVIGGAPHVNVGVYSREARSRIGLAPLLDDAQGRAGGPAPRHYAAPIRCFDARPFAAPGVLLVGDAAGVEPLMGEGISFALEYGRWAADEIVRGFACGDHALTGAEARFRRSWVGKKLRRLTQAATMFYGPGARVWLAVAARWTGAQEVGLRWYNGVDGWDRRSGWSALGTALRRSTLRHSAVARAARGMQ